jgi:hypothetical protein
MALIVAQKFSAVSGTSIKNLPLICATKLLANFAGIQSRNLREFVATDTYTRGNDFNHLGAEECATDLKYYKIIIVHKTPCNSESCIKKNNDRLPKHEIP